ncbi:class I SAM-dependent methyltransferase [Flammeovirgaceae bacterium SG7u.111]|nr:class I SAM-dependent methyltransferase [Flammeovirgaceae bacterium SG7u.132]WPO34070.1 class I SAM-dependent methyltransferase [Flammeovirgaceae bacterium SG7u.111]
MPKKRLHLFEVEDFPWYPNFIREGQTDYLRFLTQLFNVFQAIVPLVREVMEKTGQQEIVDMCSGGGGSMLLLRKQLKEATGKPFKATLTDLYPNISAYEYIKKESAGEIGYLPQSVDAVQGPEIETGFFTIFNGFHHFEPAQAKAILQKAVDRKMPIGIFEPIDRSAWQIIANIFALTVLMLLTTPFIRPFRWQRLVFTYLIPLIPLCTLWDGIVSVLRLYDPEMMQQLISELPENDFHWETGKASHPFGKVIYLIGYPKEFL